jgi:hypothetical protein
MKSSKEKKMKKKHLTGMGASEKIFFLLNFLFEKMRTNEEGENRKKYEEKKNVFSNTNTIN